MGAHQEQPTVVIDNRYIDDTAVMLYRTEKMFKRLHLQLM